MKVTHALGAAIVVSAVLIAGVAVATALTTDGAQIENENASDGNETVDHGLGGSSPDCWPYGCGDTIEERMRTDDQILPCEENASQACWWEENETQ